MPTALLLCPCAQGHLELCVLLICALCSPAHSVQSSTVMTLCCPAEKVPEGLKTVPVHQLRVLPNSVHPKEGKASLKMVLA